MPNPRVRIDERGQPKVCLVKVPVRLAKFLYAAALKARQGKGGVHVEESEIVVSLIEEWAKNWEKEQGALNWQQTAQDLVAERDAAESKGGSGETEPAAEGEQLGSVVRLIEEWAGKQTAEGDGHAEGQKEPVSPARRKKPKKTGSAD